MSDFTDAKTGVEQYRMLPRQGTFVHIGQVFRLADKALGEKDARIAELEARIAALEAENKRLQVGWNCAELAVFMKDGLKRQAEAEVERLKASHTTADWNAKQDRIAELEAVAQALHTTIREEVVAREQAEAEVARLKCCGTCDHFDSFGSVTYCRFACPERIHAYDHERHYSSVCAYDPSEWLNEPVAERGTG